MEQELKFASKNSPNKLTSYSQTKGVGESQSIEEDFKMIEDEMQYENSNQMNDSDYLKELME